MHFSIAVIISLLFCHRVVSSGGSFLREKTVRNGETILEQFFAVSEIYSAKQSSWHVTILGASDDQIRQTSPLIEEFPYFVGSDAMRICAAKEFAQNTVIVYFLTSLEEEYVTKVVGSLFNCKRIQIYFIFEGIVANEVDIEFLLRPVFEKIFEQVIFVHHSTKSLKFYKYKITTDCSVKVELLADWVLEGNTNRFLDRLVRSDYQGCPGPILATHRPPWMYLSEDANGTLRIAGGLEGNIISTIAEKLNFTLLVHLLGPSEKDKISRMKALISDGTIIGIANLPPSKGLFNATAVSHPYAKETIVWCVPRITHWKSDIMTSEFSWMTWVLIGLTFLASFAVEKFVRNTNYLNKGNDNKSGCCSIILDLIGSTLGNPIVHRPLSIGGKALLIIYISYSMVITTAYRTSSSSMLTAGNSESLIFDLEGIIKANLTTGGDSYKLNILKDQIGEHKLVRELIKRYVIEPNVSKALRRVSNEKNFALLTSLTDVAYHKSLFAEAGETVSFDVLSKRVLTHSSVMGFRKSWMRADKINHVIDSLAAGGLLRYWIRNNSKQYLWDSEMARYSQMVNTEEKLHGFTRDKFYHIFYIYCLALTLCALVFLGELLVHEFKLAGRVERFANLIRFEARRCARRF